MNANGKLLSIVIPCFNEAKSLPSVLPTTIEFARTKNFEILVVNDGSSDESGKILEDFRAKHPDTLTVITHPVNRGYGGALKTGLRNVKTQYAVTMDADGQHHLDDVETLLSQAIAGEFDLLIGNRGNSAGSSYRKIGKTLIRFFAKIVLPNLNITDLNSGMKIYRSDLAKTYLRICPNGMAFSDVMTLLYVKNFRKTGEVPIRIHDRKFGVSTISTWTAIDTVWRILIIAALFSPMRIFLPIAMFMCFVGILWAAPFLFSGKGITIGAAVLIFSGFIFGGIGILAELLSISITKDLE